MIKTIKTMSKQEKERYTVPRKVQDVIPVRRIWPVSYTHLDVYKRQHQGSAGRPCQAGVYPG